MIDTIKDNQTQSRAENRIDNRANQRAYVFRSTPFPIKMFIKCNRNKQEDLLASIFLKKFNLRQTMIKSKLIEIQRGFPKVKLGHLLNGQLIINFIFLWLKKKTLVLIKKL